MEQEIVLAFGAPIMHEWLERKLRESGLPQKRFATLLDIDPPQLNRIIKGKEPISERVLRHACHIFCLNDVEIHAVMAFHEVYKARKSFDRKVEIICKRYKGENLHELTSSIQKMLVSIAEKLYERSYLLGPERSLKRLTGFLIDAEILTGDMIRAYVNEEPLVAIENTAFHLRQPLSAFVGAVMKEDHLGRGLQATELRNKVISDFRLLAKQRYISGSGTDYLQQHAVHMLSRYGGNQDRELISKYLISDDILARRMAMFGMALSGDPDINRKLLRLISDDPYFLQAVASFDAVHYGDAALIGGRLPMSISMLENTVGNSLGCIMRDVEEENIDLNFIKITSFIRSFGPGVIGEHHKPAITGVLQTISTSNHLSQPRQEFQHCLQKII